MANLPSAEQIGKYRIVHARTTGRAHVMVFAVEQFDPVAEFDTAEMAREAIARWQRDDAQRKSPFAAKKAHMGQVDEQGVIRFVSGDFDECRAFLLGLGLTLGCRPVIDGWHKPGWRGIIDYFSGQWHAAAWPTDSRSHQTAT